MKFFRSKPGLVLLTTTSALTFHAYAPHSLSIPPDLNLGRAGGGGVEAVIDATVRSSRAISMVPFFFLYTSSVSLSSLSLLCLPGGLTKSCRRLLSPLWTTNTLFMGCHGAPTSINVNYPRSLLCHLDTFTPSFHSSDAAEISRHMKR